VRGIVEHCFVGVAPAVADPTCTYESPPSLTMVAFVDFLGYLMYKRREEEILSKRAQTAVAADSFVNERGGVPVLSSTAKPSNSQKRGRKLGPKHNPSADAKSSPAAHMEILHNAHPPTVLSVSHSIPTYPEESKGVRCALAKTQNQNATVVTVLWIDYHDRIHPYGTRIPIGARTFELPFHREIQESKQSSCHQSQHYDKRIKLLYRCGGRRGRLLCRGLSTTRDNRESYSAICRQDDDEPTLGQQTKEECETEWRRIWQW
jgi:hypothetical protein